MRWIGWALAAAGCGFHHGAAGSDATRDGSAGGDARIDGGPLTPPTVVASVHAHAANVSTQTYALNTPASAKLLLVAVHTGENACLDPGPAITAVAYNGVAMTKVAAILGVPNCATDTRSEVYSLVSPPAGMHDIRVMLSATQQTVHGTAIAFAGVDVASPIRDWVTQENATASSNVGITSAPDDLVVSFVGQGNQIDDAGTGGATVLFIDNVSNGTSLDNTGASTLTGAASVTSVWRFGMADNWQDVVVSLRP